MPEGDTVHLLARRLRGALDGQRVQHGEIRSGGAAGTRLDGWIVVEHDTHGKHLITRFDTGLSLHTHLRMQGSWSVIRPGRQPPRHVQDRGRVRMRLEDGRTAWGIDLPVVELLSRRDEAQVLGHLGPDPLRADWDAGVAVGRLAAAPERAAVAALLDQRNIAGLGNLWVNELCFLEGIHPWRPIGTVRLDRLVARAAAVLTTSVRVPGMYQTTTGDTRRGRRHWVVGMAGRPCLRCRTPISVRVGAADDPEQRRTWWCSRCQPAVALGQA